MSEDITQALRGVNGDGMVRYRFSFVPQNTGAPTFVGGKYVKSVTRDGTGHFLVEFYATFAAILGFHWGVRETAAGGLAGMMAVQIDPSATTLIQTNPNTKGSVVALRTVNNAGAATDYTTSTAGAQVDVEITFGKDPNNLV